MDTPPYPLVTRLTECRLGASDLRDMAAILCVSDDRHLCSILGKTLANEGFRVFSSHDGESALRDFQSHQPQLVVVDILLPKRDGFEVLEQIRKRDPEGQRTPVVLMSAFRITEQYEERARSLRAQALLAKPIKLERLCRVAHKYVKLPPPTAQSPKSTAAPMQGTFAELSFPHLLHQLHGLRASGVLSLSSGKKRKLLQIREGYPEAIKSNLVGECLGNWLVRKGVISEESFQESVRRMKMGEGLQGQILVAMERLEEDALGEALREQALEKIGEIFSWTTGRFRFQLGRELQRANAIAVEGSPANLIIRGVREQASIEAIDAFFCEREDDLVVPGATDFYRFQEVSLSEAEQERLAGIEGRDPLGSFLDCDERFRRTLYGLLVTEYLQLRPRASRAGSANVRMRQSPARKRASEETNRERVMRADLAKLAARYRRQNYFQVLGLDADTTDEQVESAFERAAQQVHPDRYAKASEAVRQLAEEAYAELEKAYATLSNAKERTAYVLELRKGERQRAEEKANRRALEAELNFQKGEGFLRSRSFPEALACFGKALEAYSDDGEYHSHYGWALYLCHPEDPGMLQEAIEHVRRGSQLSATRETSYLFLGRLYKVAGRTAAAEKMFTRALQITPECVEATRELRLINLRREKRGLIGRLLKR